MGWFGCGLSLTIEETKRGEGSFSKALGLLPWRILQTVAISYYYRCRFLRQFRSYCRRAVGYM